MTRTPSSSPSRRRGPNPAPNPTAGLSAEIEQLRQLIQRALAEADSDADPRELLQRLNAISLAIQRLGNLLQVERKLRPEEDESSALQRAISQALDEIRGELRQR